jgi:hypothetical protein
MNVPKHCSMWCVDKARHNPLLSIRAFRDNSENTRTILELYTLSVRKWRKMKIVPVRPKLFDIWVLH